MVNALLFAGLTPLWEGFDEAFHYGYVEELWQSRRLPVLGRTPVPYDVAASFAIAPVSFVTRRAMPEAIPFDAWFALPQAERESRRRELQQLPADSRTVSRGNYEAHQPPLAYLLLAPVDWSLRGLPITQRVLVLRIFCGVGAVLLLYFGAASLCRELAVPPAFANVALFAIFSTEMLYATVAHVGNDSLAVSVSACFLAALLRLLRKPCWRHASSLAAWLAAGLLAKSYFPVFALLAAGVAVLLVWRRSLRMGAALSGAAIVVLLAGPWYIRNLSLYGNAGARRKHSKEWASGRRWRQRPG